VRRNDAGAALSSIAALLLIAASPPPSPSPATSASPLAVAAPPQLPWNFDPCGGPQELLAKFGPTPCVVVGGAAILSAGYTSAKINGKVSITTQIQARTRNAATPEAIVQNQMTWRRVIGVFQLTIPVKNKEALLLREERDLSVLRWIAQAIPATSRWYPVFHRYLELIGERVGSFGGDPGKITPSPTGEGIPKPRPHPKPSHGEGRNEHRCFTGKIESLRFDHFGDFIGFVLETECGDHTFFSREREVEHLAERAWRERLRVSVIACDHDHDRPERIIIHKPPASFVNVKGR
jgi:hypothetical protein